MAGSSNSVAYGDSNYAEQLQKWFDELDSDEGDELEDDLGEVQDFNTDTEEDESEHEYVPVESSEFDTNVGRAFYGKNRFKWSQTPFQVRTSVRNPDHNLCRFLPGLKGPINQIGNLAEPLKIWEHLFTEDMLNEILQRTNEKLQIDRDKYKKKDKIELQDMDTIELRSLLGVLYFSSIFKSNDEDLSSLFATDGSGRDLVRSVMSLKRCLILLSCLRFDNAANRQERSKEDSAAAISWIFNRLVENSQSCYTANDLLCIDEMLVGFRGRCRFRIYMPNKPNKYGIKIMIMCDARTSYFYNGYIYTGKNSDGQTLSEDEKKFSVPTQSVLRLSRPVYKSNRNITADNWFSSLELINKLREKNLTYVGTLKKNKREIPNEFLPNRRREVESSLYGFTKDTTLLSYVPKKGKAVIMVSSMHHRESTDTETGKPEIIAFYNETKGGVDSLDHKCANYSTNRRTRRWPMAIFYTMLNISSCNAFVLYGCFRDNKTVTRFQFIKKLAQELVLPQMNRRLVNSRIPRELRLTIGRILNKPAITHSENGQENKRRRCGVCPRSSDKKTHVSCKFCNVPICAQCTEKICKECANH